MFMTVTPTRARFGNVSRTAVRRSRTLYGALEPVFRQWAVARWQREGRPVPAPAGVKRDILLRTARQYGLRVLVETGTFRGDTVLALARYFSRVVSIELSPELHAKVAQLTTGISNAELLLGDSTQQLPRVLATLREPALFWLDAHYTEGTALGDKVSPIEEELDAVLSHPVAGHVILIDDAREFHASTTSGYPPPQAVTSVAAKHGYVTAEQDDIFFLTPS